ncbi:MAG: UDP-N-acetylglucosamine--N-acetylmuramyl-(pentapeptide) pyrophosphoryl-undecaprenol N-acetylglucosamine transferase [Oscillospiraceae bacterium]
MKVLLAGGGTAGHLNPALAIAEIIRSHRPDAEFCFVGTPGSLEETLLAKTDYRFERIKVKGFQRKITAKNIRRNAQAVAYLFTAGRRARAILSDFQPDIVIGTGGYVSGPIVRKAAQMGIKTAIHEQNAFPGVTTKLLSKHADAVMLTTEAAAKYLPAGVKYTVTGLPVRSGFVKTDRSAAKRALGFAVDEPCILSTGGSLGAGRINETVADLMRWYQKTGAKINHIHAYGGMGRDSFVNSLTERGIDPVANPRLDVREYIDNMALCMAAADLVISRCGANILTEIEAMGRGSVLIPSPIVAENHQYHNGMVLQNAGAAVVIEQKNLTGEALIAAAKELTADPKRLAKLGENAAKLFIPDTNERIYTVLRELLPKQE